MFCVAVAVYFGVFTLLPFKYEHDDYRNPPALGFAIWFWCVLRQLRKGNLWQRRWEVGALLAGPFMGLICLGILRVFLVSSEDELEWMTCFVGVAAFAVGGVVLSWTVENSAPRQSPET